MGCGSSKATAVVDGSSPEKAPRDFPTQESVQMGAKSAVSTAATATTTTTAAAAATTADAVKESAARTGSGFARQTSSGAAFDIPADKSQIRRTASGKAPRRLLEPRESQKIDAERLMAKQLAAEERRLARLSSTKRKQEDAEAKRKEGVQKVEDKVSMTSRKQAASLSSDLEEKERKRQAELEAKKEKLKERDEHAKNVRSRAARHLAAITDAQNMEFGGEDEDDDGDDSDTLEF